MFHNLCFATDFNFLLLFAMEIIAKLITIQECVLQNKKNILCQKRVLIFLFTFLISTFKQDIVLIFINF